MGMMVTENWLPKLNNCHALCQLHFHIWYISFSKEFLQVRILSPMGKYRIVYVHNTKPKPLMQMLGRSLCGGVGFWTSLVATSFIQKIATGKRRTPFQRLLLHMRSSTMANNGSLFNGKARSIYHDWHRLKIMNGYAKGKDKGASYRKVR